MTYIIIYLFCEDGCSQYIPGSDLEDLGERQSKLLLIKFLRLIQYATLHSVEHQTKGSAFKVYEQMRMTRKLLRFLRTLEYTTKIRQEIP